jgi:hypothetical protein
MAIIGHSHAAESGTAIPDYGWGHKLATHLQPARLRTAARGGSIACMPDSNNLLANVTARQGGYARILFEFDRSKIKQAGPYLAAEQLVSIWWGVHDVAYLGPNNLAPFEQAMTTIIARMKTSVAFNATDTTARTDQYLTAFTPLAYTGTWAQPAPATQWLFTSNATWMETAGTFPGTYLTVTLPTDFPGGWCNLMTAGGNTGGQGASWEAHDVTKLTTTSSAQALSGQANITLTSVGSLANGDTITVNTGASRETKTILSIAGSVVTVTTNFANTHASGTAVSSPGFVDAWDDRNLNGYQFGLTRGTDGRFNVITRRMQLPQGPTTSLSADTTTTASSITVASTANFPAAGSLTIDNETLTYTGKTATTFTGLTRGTGGFTLAAVHYSGATVRGFRKVEMRPLAVTTKARIDSFGIEANPTPLVAIVLPPRMMRYEFWRLWPYDQNQVQLASGTSGGATTLTLTNTTVSDNPLASGATTINVASTTNFPPAGTLLIESEAISYTGVTATSFTGCTRGAKGTTAASHVLSTPVTVRVPAGSTITVGSAGAAETRRVLSQAAATITLTSGLTNAHSSSELVVAGMQDFDLRDTTGPSVTASLNTVVAAFNDPNIFTVDFDDLTNVQQDSFAGDYVHFSESSHAKMAQRMLEVLAPKYAALSYTTKPVVDDRRSYNPDSVYGDITLANNWANTAGTANATGTEAPLALWKDSINGVVYLIGAVTQSPATNPFAAIATLPKGMRPRYNLDFPVSTDRGIGVLRIAPDGTVALVGAPAANCTFNLSFIAEG